MASDFELLDRWSAGDPDAGNELFQRYFHSVYYFFANKVAGDVQDLVQSTFLAFVHSRDRFRRKASFRTYLFTIARNELYRHLRERRRAEVVDFGVTSLVDLGVSPTADLAQNAEHGALLRALRALPVDQQLLLELYYWEELSVAELSALFDIAETATRARLTRARKSLRRHVEALGESTASGADLADFDAWARSLRIRHAGEGESTAG